MRRRSIRETGIRLSLTAVGLVAAFECAHIAHRTGCRSFSRISTGAYATHGKLLWYFVYDCQSASARGAAFFPQPATDRLFAVRIFWRLDFRRLS